jgi:hypothetical protein
MRIVDIIKEFEYLKRHFDYENKNSLYVDNKNIIPTTEDIQKYLIKYLDNTAGREVRREVRIFLFDKSICTISDVISISLYRIEGEMRTFDMNFSIKSSTEKLYEELKKYELLDTKAQREIKLNIIDD